MVLYYEPFEGQKTNFLGMLPATSAGPLREPMTPRSSGLMWPALLVAS